jgi:hypothetical protein
MNLSYELREAPMLRYCYDPSGNLTTEVQASAIPPQIIGQPVQQIVEPGQSVTFSVVVADTNEVAYQWLFEGADISGATGDSLVVPKASVSNEGQYSVVVTNITGSVTSASATLTLRSNPIVNTSKSPRLLVYSDEGGSVTAAPMKPSYNLGDTITLTATPFTDNLFAGWVGDLTTVDNPAMLTMNRDKMVRARFSSTLLRLAAYSGPGGSLTVTPMKLNYALGETVTLAPLASPQSVFLGWTGDLSGSDNPATLTMDKNKTLRARFATPASIPGLIALWRGEADASDLTGRHNGAFYPGGTVTAPGATAPGKVGEAFNFDGTVHVRVPDDLTVPIPASLQPAQFTAEAWVFPTASSPVRQTIIAQGDYSNSWDLAMTNNILEFWAHGLNFPPGSEPSAIPSNEWTHLAITFDGFTKRLYVNGIEAASQDESRALDYGIGAPLTIGSNSSGAELFNGQIDEVALYDRALTGDEILDIYNADFLGKNFSQPYFLSPAQLPQGRVKTAYSHQFVTIPDAPFLTFTLSEGRPPPVMSLSPTGLISGTPWEAGSFRFTVRATDSADAFTEQVYVLQVSS